MKFATYTIEGRTTFGGVHLSGGDVKFSDLGASLGHDLGYWLHHERQGALLKAAAESRAVFAEDQIRYEVPVQSGKKIVCIGVKYAKRNA